MRERPPLAEIGGSPRTGAETSVIGGSHTDLVASPVLFGRQALCRAGFSTTIDEIAVLSDSAGRMSDRVGSAPMTEFRP